MRTNKLISFDPILPDRPVVLILGSMPSKLSFTHGQYYGNPRNHFWPILFELFEQQAIEDYEAKITFVKQHGIALWDTIGACYRQGSLDQHITEEEPNDIIGLLESYPTIRLIACNGTKSYNIFKKHVDLSDHPLADVVKLPSSSPIPGKYTKSFAEKVEAWKVIRHNKLLP